jgi:uncharacterized protein with HEPN domain
MKRDEQLYLQNILDAIEAVATYLQGVDRERFDKNKLVQDGVIRQITIIGEATKLLSNELRDKYSQVPWRQIARMRDTLIHRYFGVDLEQVWLTAQNDLPVLKTEVTKILGELRSHEQKPEGEEAK